MTSITSTPNLGAMTMLRGPHHHHGAREAGQLAEQLFTKLDSSGQGYLKKADLQAALDQGSPAAKSVTPGDLDAMFSGFDTDGDGKLTKQEFTDSVKKLAAQLTQQLRMMDVQGTAQNGAPLPPPAAASETGGFSKDELSSQLQQISSSDSKSGNLLSTLVQNFDQADANGDGKLDVNEAVKFAKGGTATADTGATDATSVTDDNAKMMMQLVKLLQAYGDNGEQHKPASAMQAVTA